MSATWPFAMDYELGLKVLLCVSLIEATGEPVTVNEVLDLLICKFSMSEYDAEEALGTAVSAGVVGLDMNDTTH